MLSAVLSVVLTVVLSVVLTVMLSAVLSIVLSVVLSVALSVVQVWFWRFRSPWSERVRELQRIEKAARAVVSQLNKVHAAKLSEAKAALGLWSEMGMDESRALFW